VSSEVTAFSNAIKTYRCSNIIREIYNTKLLRMEPFSNAIKLADVQI
jgi:hypothetical protein